MWRYRLKSKGSLISLDASHTLSAKAALAPGGIDPFYFWGGLRGGSSPQATLLRRGKVAASAGQQTTLLMDPPKIIQRPLDANHGSVYDRSAEDDDPSIRQHHYIIPEGTIANSSSTWKPPSMLMVWEEIDRKLGVLSTSLLIINRMIGSGIFSTPSTITQATDGVGASLFFWVLGGIITLW